MFSTKKYFLVAIVTSIFDEHMLTKVSLKKRGFEKKIKIHLFQIEELFLKISN